MKKDKIRNQTKKDPDKAKEMLGPVMLGLDPEGNMILYEGSNEEILGYDRDQVIGEPIWNFLKKDEDTVKDFFLNPDREELSRYKNFSWGRPDGREIPIRWKIIQLKGAEGEIENIICVGVNLNEFEKLYQDFQENQEVFEIEKDFFEIMREEAPIGILTVNETENGLVISSANSGTEKILDTENNKIEGKKLEDFLDSRKLKEKIDDFQTDEAEKLKLDTEIVFSEDGTIPVNVRIVTLSDEFENDYLLYVTSDETPVKKEKENLSSKLKYYQAIVDYAQVGIAVFQKGEISYLNERATEIFECTEESLKELGFLNFVHPDDKEKAQVLHREKIGGKLPFSIEVSIVTKEGQIKYISCKGLEISYNGDPASQLIIEDITEYKEIENRLKNRRKELSQAYMRLREKESELRKRKEALEKTSETRAEFIDLVSHELSSLLTPVRTHVEMLLSRDTGDLSQYQEESLKEVQEKIKEVNDLVQDLLDLSRIEAGRIKAGEEAVSISGIIQNVISDLSREIDNKRHKLEFEVEEDLPNIVGDQRLLDKVFRNIIRNAIEYTPEEGEIEVKARSYDRGVMVKISDTGVGMTKKEQEKVFQKFYRGKTGKKEKARGLGIGLSITQNFVDLHDGNIKVDSKKGEGTTFKIYLPKN